MKVDIYYDPVRPYTYVMINGAPVSQSHIYGFLYPVRGYVLQTWLYPSGSWHGLKNELMDLTREESSQIVFHSRKVDYLDFEKAIGDLSNCGLAFEEIDYTSISAVYLSDAQKLLEDIVNTPVVMERDESEITQTFSDLFPEQNAQLRQLPHWEGEKWLSCINNKADLLRCINSDECCLIDGDSMLSYDNYDLIDALTAGLKRSPDMLICTFSSNEKKVEFINYNAQLKNHTVAISDADDTKWKEQLNLKYGIPYEYRCKLKWLRTCFEVLKPCFDTETDADSDANKDTGIKAAANAQQIRNEIRNRHKKRWATHQKKHLDELCRLLYGIEYIRKESESDE